MLLLSANFFWSFGVKPIKPGTPASLSQQTSALPLMFLLVLKLAAKADILLFRLTWSFQEPALELKLREVFYAKTSEGCMLFL